MVDKLLTTRFTRDILFANMSQLSQLEFVELLQKAGLKLTIARKLLMSVIIRFTRPFSAEEVQDELRKIGAHVHRATVYRDLISFTQKGILRELALVGTMTHYYEVRNGVDHYHFVCRNCFEIINLDTELLAKHINMYEKTLFGRGLQVENHNLKFYGQCLKCFSKAQKEGL